MNVDDIVTPEVHGTIRPLHHDRWGAAFAEPDPVGITLDRVTKAMAEITSARIQMWSALDDLEHYAVRDSRDMVVTLRDGVIEDAKVIGWYRSDRPTIFLMDLGAVDRALFEGAVLNGEELARRYLV